MIKSLAEKLSVLLVTNKIVLNEESKYYIYGFELILHDLFIFITLATLSLITNTVLISIVFTCFFVFYDPLQGDITARPIGDVILLH